jgi:hypothetical protein
MRGIMMRAGTKGRENKKMPIEIRPALVAENLASEIL